MSSYSLITGFVALGVLAVSNAVLAQTEPITLNSAVTPSNDRTIMIENDKIAVQIERIGRRFVSVDVQDKVNGRSYSFGNDIFCLEVLDENTDEACSKKNLPRRVTYSPRRI